VAWVVARLTGTGTAGRPGGARAASPVDDGNTRGIVVAYGIMGFGYILPATFLPVLARGVVDDPRVFGLTWPIFGATAALSTLVAARLLQGSSRLQTWAACQLLMGVGVLLPAIWSNAWTITFSALLVGGTFMIITLAGVQEMRARAASPAHAATLVGRITAAFALGQIIGPMVATLLLRASSQGLALALATGAAALFATGAWLWHSTSRPTLSQELPHA
jgi:predicted MFS family arabinose efflux permease